MSEIELPSGTNLTPKPLGDTSFNGRYDLYVDATGGPIKSEGWSGWGMALVAGGSLAYEACGTTATRVTTNAAELEAVIQGLAYISRLGLPVTVPLWTDSQYVAQSIAMLPLLHQRSFQNDKRNADVANKDRLVLIFELLYDMQLVNATVIRHVKGHSNNIGNEAADRLSKEAAYKGHSYYKEHTSRE